MYDIDLFNHNDGDQVSCNEINEAYIAMYNTDLFNHSDGDQVSCNENKRGIHCYV